MNRKKSAIALCAVVLVASIVVYLSSRNGSLDSIVQLAGTGTDGVLNPEQSATAMKTQPMPQLSDARFQPPPPITTGTYTDPTYRKPVDSKNKNDAR